MYNHVIFIQNIYLFRNPPASTRPSALRRCGPPPRALLCIRNSDVEALCPQALLVSLNELHAVLMLGTLLRDACVPGTLAGRRQNKCKIESRSASCPNASGVTSRSLDDLSLSLSLCFGCFRFEVDGLSPLSPSFPGRRSRSSSSASRLPLPPRPSHCPPLPSPINCLSLTDHHVAHQRSWLSWLSWLANRYPQFWVRGFGGGVKQKKRHHIFFWRRGRRARQVLRSGEAEGARARPF